MTTSLLQNLSRDSFRQMIPVPFFADLVVIARSLYPIPSRTRPSKSSAPMVLNLKVWKSRSPPGLPRTEHPLSRSSEKKSPAVFRGAFLLGSVIASGAKQSSSARHARACRGHPRLSLRRVTPAASPYVPLFLSIACAELHYTPSATDCPSLPVCRHRREHG
jgi:hypothetical protein